MLITDSLMNTSQNDMHDIKRRERHLGDVGQDTGAQRVVAAERASQPRHLRDERGRQIRA
jgi:hypothetical protein